MTPFWVNFYVLYKQDMGSKQFWFLMPSYNNTICLKTIILHFSIVSVKINFHTYTYVFIVNFHRYGSMSALFYISAICMSIISPITNSLSYCSLKLHHKIRELEFSKFVLLVWNYFNIIILCHFHMCFRNILWIYTKFLWHFEFYKPILSEFLMVLNLAIHEHSIYFNLFKTFKNDLNNVL
jgi:hypothetical protein